MKCYMLWHCGGYALPELTDVEEFDSLSELKRTFDRRQFDSYYPCVHDDTPDEGGPSGWVFLYDPREDHGQGDLYPDRIISYGPRGGVRVEVA